MRSLGIGLFYSVMVLGAALPLGCFKGPDVLNTSEFVPPPRPEYQTRELEFPVRIERFIDERSDRSVVGYRQTFSSGPVGIAPDREIAEVFETLVTRALERKGIRSGPSVFILQGTIQRAVVGSVGMSNSVKGQVGLEVSLLNSKTGARVWSKTYNGQALGVEHQAVLGAAFRDLLASLEQDDSILTAKPLYLAATREQSETGQATAGPGAKTVPASDVDLLPTGKMQTRKHAYAVVIGVEQYREKLPRAEFADRDAKLVGEYLTKVLGYPEENVVVRLNDRATRSDLEKYFETWLPNNVEASSLVFVYYSGHGAPNTKTREAYLVPYDGDPSFVENTAYPLKRLYAALDKLPAKDIVVVLDSCFSGAGGRSVLAKGARPMGIALEHAVASTGKAMVLAASSGDQISSTYEEKGHGLLTYFFLKGLQGDGDVNKDGVIELAKLYEYLKPNVQRIARKQYNSEQTPQLLGSPEMLRKGGGRLIERVAQ
jgi:hypothetical protein